MNREQYEELKNELFTNLENTLDTAMSEMNLVDYGYKDGFNTACTEILNRVDDIFKHQMFVNSSDIRKEILNVKNSLYANPRLRGDE